MNNYPHDDGVDLPTKWYLYQSILDYFDENIIWQQQAKEIMTKVLSDAYQDFDKKKWPLSVLFFKWPTWVGKTEMTKQTAKLLFGISDWYLNIPCEQLKESHECTATLFGAPAWYIWYNDKPLLDPDNVYRWWEEWYWNDTLHKIAKRRDNMAVIVFDEIEKMHPIGVQSLLSTIDEGIVRLKNGTTVNLSNAIIIFTSNIWETAANNIMPTVWFNKDPNLDSQKKLNEKDKYFNRIFSPEFIGRLDYIVEFEPLDLWHTDIFIKKLQKELIYETLASTSWNMLIQYNDSIAKYIKDVIDTSKWNRNVHKIREQKIRYALGTILKINKLSYYDEKHVLYLDISENGDLKCKLKKDNNHDLIIDMDSTLKIKNIPTKIRNDEIDLDSVKKYMIWSVIWSITNNKIKR